MSNSWRSLEILLVNTVELSLTWDPNCALCNLVGASTFTITDAKLYVPIVTLSTEDNVKLSKLLSEGFKRPVYWNKYKIIPNKTYDENDYILHLAYRDRGGANRGIELQVILQKTLPSKSKN